MGNRKEKFIRGHNQRENKNFKQVSKLPSTPLHPQASTPTPTPCCTFALMASANLGEISRSFTLEGWVQVPKYIGSKQNCGHWEWELGKRFLVNLESPE